MVNLNDAKTLIATLRTVYASQFNKQFPSDGLNAIPMQAVEQIALNTLVGIQKHQFNNALGRLYTAGGKFMPSLAEFRSWCVGESWMSAEEAWSRACQFTVSRKTKITLITKYALDEVQYLISLGKMKPAQDNFMATYNVMVNQAQIKGRVQEWYQPPALLKQPEHTPMKNDELREKLADFMKKANFKDRVVVKPQKLEAMPKPEPVDTYWPDPFENPKEYLSQCDTDGHSVPTHLRNQLGGGV